MSKRPTSGFLADRSNGVCFSLFRIDLSAPNRCGKTWKHTQPPHKPLSFLLQRTQVQQHANLFLIVWRQSLHALSTMRCAKVCLPACSKWDRAKHVCVYSDRWVGSCDVTWGHVMLRFSVSFLQSHTWTLSSTFGIDRRALAQSIQQNVHIFCYVCTNFWFTRLTKMSAASSPMQRSWSWLVQAIHWYLQI